jgi:hypothetical protein
MEKIIAGEDLYSYPDGCAAESRIRNCVRIILELAHYRGVRTLGGIPDRTRVVCGFLSRKGL